MKIIENSTLFKVCIVNPTFLCKLWVASSE